ncbi:uncharacterized protein LOC129774332 [Toxorhynchites rutilus septentrionalis]|uniref:uncharacterized protein LOC129774332 n=1 Tax=Toxorhynchites rutilus septentrionalis TaxID=329112 RepID=UPI00247AAC76|nr:uncharacterized protein LOC129774332 [Toxorhynchites rutilus septentrionalis]
MKLRSTTTNLMCYVTAVSREIEIRRQVDSVYIDFAKAFDTVPHILIISKMKYMGFPDRFMEWLWSYLSDRSAYVVVNSSQSRPFNITSGVPQLSFADDLKFYRSITSPLDHAALQDDINPVLIWCGDNGMRVNNNKCKIITFSRRCNPAYHEYSMEGKPLD